MLDCGLGIPCRAIFGAVASRWCGILNRTQTRCLMGLKLLPFQRIFLSAVENPRYDIVALSGPRSLGKTFIAGLTLDRCLTPFDTLNQPGQSYILGAASVKQARLTYQFVREVLEPTGEYRFIDSSTRLGITHLESNTKLRVTSSNGKTAFGLVNVPICVIDEPGALELAGGQLLFDALSTAIGKVGSKLKLILCGTLAPGATSSGHWWWDLVNDGTIGSTHVQYFHGELETWDKWPTIRKANPLVAVDAGFRAKLLEERDAARADTRKKAQFLSYRLNIPTRDEAEMLITVDDWKRVEAREIPAPEGRPIVALDLGGGRAWSAAVCVYPSGLIDAIAVAPGIPSIEDQETRDRVNRGTYLRLVDDGLLLIADGLRVPHPRQLWSAVLSEWGKSYKVMCDRFRLADLQDAIKGGANIEPRVTRWSEASADIRALRKHSKDGPLAVVPHARNLIAASLSVAQVQNDDQGGTRLIKRGSNNQSRDDVAAALTLGAGAWERRQQSKGSVRSLGLA